jgi:homoserine dehydrogenase
MATNNALRVAIAGVGTVGGGIAQILSSNAQVLAARCRGREIQLVAVADQRPLAELSAELQGHNLVSHYDDAVKMVHDEDLDVVVETMGGYSVSKTMCEAALHKGISVVTANKALLAVHGKALTTIAERNNATIGWEAAVGGGIPCIRALRQGCAANNVEYAAGILNGTCNFILTTMKETGRDFDDVLNEAQALGYAETPPDLDVDGIDTAHKISLVASVATGYLPSFDTVHTEGIRSISGEDVNLAARLNHSIKLLGIASTTTSQDGQTKSVLQRVHPALIPNDTSLGSTHGVLNALYTLGDFVGPVFSQGPGAGREATASACVADLMDIALDNTVPTFGLPIDDMPEMKSVTMDERIGQYFIRFNTEADRGDVVRSLETAGVSYDKHAEEEGSKGNEGQRCIITNDVQENIIMPVIKQEMESGKIQGVPIRVEGPW